MTTHLASLDLVGQSASLLGPMNKVEHEILSKPLEEEFASSLNL
jgi:hypothetical protein